MSEGNSMERTFAIIKQDAVAAGHSGAILSAVEDAGFRLSGMRLVRLTKVEAEGFYAVHRERPFFDSLTNFMSSGPAIVMALDAPDAILRWRTLMGATDPAQAADGTLRKRFGLSLEHNATHGSDAPAPAAFRARSAERTAASGDGVAAPADAMIATVRRANLSSPSA